MGQGRTKRGVIDIVRSKVYVEKKKEGKNIDHFKLMEKVGELGLNKGTQT